MHWGHVAAGAAGCSEHPGSERLLGWHGMEASPTSCAPSPPELCSVLPSVTAVQALGSQPCLPRTELRIREQPLLAAQRAVPRGWFCCKGLSHCELSLLFSAPFCGLCHVQCWFLQSTCGLCLTVGQCLVVAHGGVSSASLQPGCQQDPVCWARRLRALQSWQQSASGGPKELEAELLFF